MTIYAVMTAVGNHYPTCDGVAFNREEAENLAKEVIAAANFLLDETEVRVIKFEGKNFINFYDNIDWYWNVEEPELKLFG